MKLKKSHRRSACVAWGVLLAQGSASGQDLPTLEPDDSKLTPTVRPRSADSGARVLPVPNLHPSKIDFQAGGREVIVEVRNTGTGASSPAEMLLSIAIINPFTGTKVGASPFFRQQIAAIAAGKTQAFYMGELSLPSGSQDWDLNLEATVDPNRRIAELDERDNTRTLQCRVFAASPGAPSPPRAPNIRNCL